MTQKTRPPMTEAARDRQEARIYKLAATIRRDLSESVELDIAMEHARENRTKSTMARDARQQLSRDFSRF